ncbi:hypothetical protein ES705_10634 [subsurface metagenome]
MTKQCLSCKKEFVESRDNAFRCELHGWSRLIDGHWHSCPEPAKVIEPDLPKVPKAPVEPEVPEDDNVRSYMGGLVTVTTIKDHENEEIN